MDANRLFSERFGKARVSASRPVDERLGMLAEEPIRDKFGALVFLNLGAESLDVTDFMDLTGYEALANKIHLEDYVDGTPEELLLAAVAVAERLAERLMGYGRNCKVILSERDPGDPVLRFVTVRSGEEWIGDPDAYTEEAIAVWDVVPDDSRPAARAREDGEGDEKK
jgi:hypothetical protein